MSGITLGVGMVSMTHTGFESVTLNLPHVLEASRKIFNAPPHIIISASGKRVPLRPDGGGCAGVVSFFLAGDNGEVAEDFVGGVVEEDGVAVQEGVKIVLLAAVGVTREFQEGEVVERRGGDIVFGDEFVGEGVAATHDDDFPRGKDLVGGVPAAVREAVVANFAPVAGIVLGAGGEGAEGGVAVVETASLEEGAVGGESPGGAPGVGAEGEGAEGVVGEVVEDGVGGAVELEGEVVGVEAAAVVGEGDVGGAEVGALHVHGGDAYAALELHPMTSFGVCTIFNGNYELKEDALKKNKKERWEVLDLESHSSVSEWGQQLKHFNWKD
ncbi:hypothetical protein V8G54_014411 [Vigna mungo]|uniref:Uncharacterized protein n=1 Tax=Vigna mungo TaxID=3915 RepID=A0AAQ3NHH3_VIGMU